MSKSKKRIIVIAVIVVIAAWAAIAVPTISKYKNYQKKVDEMVFTDINIASISDGIYTGECDTGVIYARVEVTVEEGKLLNVNILEHRHERGAAAEVIADQMVQEQRTDVDVVSGATNSSKVIRMAVENALAGNGK